MKLEVNKLRKILNQGKIAYGTCINSFNPSIIEIAGFSGLDWCRIDNEHAWRQDSSLEDCIRGAIIGNLVPIVRIEGSDHELIRKVLEIGAMGFIIPGIKTSEEVEEIVASAKFPPYGNRGFSSRSFSAYYGLVSKEEYINWSNSEVMVGIMIETKESIKNLDKIMKVEGLDFILFGPSDYSLSIGLSVPSINHPEVQKAIEMTGEFAIKYGKYAMIGVNNLWKEQSEKYINKGYRLIELGSDYSLLANSWKTVLKEVT